jgi:F-box protein 11
MTSPAPAAFMSYVHADDRAGKLTEFRDALANAIGDHTGRDFHTFQDHEDIGWGQSWREPIEESLDTVTFLIPIITPRFFASEPCRDELRRFAERERVLQRNDLVLPVYYIDHPSLNESARRETDELLQVIAQHQYADWRCALSR